MSDEPLNLARKFKCTECPNDTFEEVMEDVTVTSPVDRVWEDGDLTYGENVVNEYGEVTSYQCVSCGFPLLKPDGRKVTNGEELVEVLTNV